MPPREYHFWVYIMASRSRQLYIGMTNDLCKRVTQHKQLQPGTYTARYNITRLVYYEHHTYVINAIAREKDLKTWNRQRKLDIIDSMNPEWSDLSKELWPQFFAPELQ